MTANNMFDKVTQENQTLDYLSNKLQLVQDELNRCADIAEMARFSQSFKANTLALRLLENSAVDTSQNSYAKKASHKVSELKVTEQQLNAKLNLAAERLVQDKEPQQTRRLALHAYAAHQKRAGFDKDHDAASRKRAKLS